MNIFFISEIRLRHELEYSQNILRHDENNNHNDNNMTTT